MNKKAILGLMLAIVMPLMGYYLVKYYGERAIHLPRRYFYDSVAGDNEKTAEPPQILYGIR
jgi:protein SCO1/2